MSGVLALFALALAAPAFVERPCEDARLTPVARCGTVGVPEDRRHPERRTINLNVIVFRATAPVPGRAPLVDIDGGPGNPSTRSLEFYLSDGAPYYAQRDVVLFDQRGTGKSNGLHCPELAAPEQAYVPMLDPAKVMRCRKSLSGHADLRFYGTGEAVEDLEAVRQALGHARIDITAVSYGTTMAMAYIAAYPRQVRAAVLTGVVPGFAMPPRFHATAAERALKLVFAECAADAACHAAIPDPDGDLVRARTRLGSLAPELFMERLRSLMYTAAGARLVPWIVHRAAAGDLEPFYKATRPRGPSALADGMFLSVTCSENFPAMDYPVALAQANATRFGDYRLRRQHHACALWPRGKRANPDPLASDVPILIFSGRLDPVSPPEWGALALFGLPNGRQLIVPQGGHVFDGLSNIECFDALMLRFFETADAKSLDSACLATMLPPPFATGE